MKAFPLPISLSLSLSLWLWLGLLVVCLSEAFATVSLGRARRLCDDAKAVPNTELLPWKSNTGSATRMAVANDGKEYSNEDSRLETATKIAEEWILDFSSALSEGRIEAAVNLFADDHPEEDYVGPLPEGKTQKQFPPFWRDMVAYTWNIVTLEGKDSIRDMLEETTRDSNKAGATTTATIWKLAEPRPSGRESFPPPLKIIDIGTESSIICEFWCDITTGNGKGYAHVRLDTTKKKATTVLTTLLELHDRPFRSDQRRSRGSLPGPVRGRKYFDKQYQHKHWDGGNEANEAEYHVAIVGAGQAGLSLAARLEAMDIPYVLFEAGSCPGSSWRHARYPSLYLHDPVWYQHMPYLEFPKTWPVYTPKDKLADWLDAYATLLDLNLQTNTKVSKAIEEYRGGNKNKLWKIETVSSTNDPSGSGGGDKNGQTIYAKHIVFATGNSSRPKIPKFRGASSVFRGIQLHTSKYTGGKAFAGKNVVVIGSNNSAFDICQDLWEQGAASVTMIQRTAGMIVSNKSILEHGLFLFNEDPQYHHEDADLLLTTTPYRILAEGGGWKAVTNRMKATDRELIERLEPSGYKFDYGYDGTGVFAKSATEGGGFYIDVGCADLLARKDVRVRYASVERLEPNEVVISDKETGKEERLPADVVVYATGFDTMESYVEQICGKEIVDKIGKTWGLGLDYKPDKDPGPWTGELRNMWKPTKVDGLWFHGGNLAQCRHYSKFLALQLAARYHGKNRSRGDDNTEEGERTTRPISSSAVAREPIVYGIHPPAFAEKAAKQEKQPASTDPSI